MRPGTTTSEYQQTRRTWWTGVSMATTGQLGAVGAVLIRDWMALAVSAVSILAGALLMALPVAAYAMSRGTAKRPSHTIKPNPSI